MRVDYKPLLEYLLRLPSAQLYHNKHLMQYLSEDSNKHLWRLCDKVIDILKLHNIDIGSCINIGTGPGFFEHKVKSRLGLDMPSADLRDAGYGDVGYEIAGYETIKKQLGVTNYIMESIWSEYFKIYDCDKVYDNALIMRFVPLNESCDTGNKLYTIIDNIGKYADNIISVEYNNNFKRKSIEKWLRDYKIGEVLNYNIYYINVKKAKKSLRNYITQK